MGPTYYIPEIQEFHVGFEYEEFWNDKPKERSVGYWKHRFLTEESAITQFRISRNDFRVKHLDRTDIEACGWEDKNSGGIFNAAGMFDYELTGSGMPLGFVNYGKPNTYRLTQMGKCWFTISATGHPQTLFHGTILNKSELLFQMKRLGIKTEAK